MVAKNADRPERVANIHTRRYILRNPQAFDLELTVQKVVGIDLVNIQPERCVTLRRHFRRSMC